MLYLPIIGRSAFFFFFLQNIYFLSLLACQLLTCKQTTALESNYYKTRYLTPKYVEFDPSVNFNILEEIKSNEGNFSTCISFEKLENLTFRRHCSSPGKLFHISQNAIICTIFGQNAKYEITSISVFRFCKN